MISLDHARLMARYNKAQNENLYGVADGLSDEARKQNRGAFFGSIHGTLCHLLWGDSTWMSRFAGLEKPPGSIRESPDWIADWAELKQRRIAFDETIIGWTATLDPEWLSGDLTWFSGAAGRELTRPRWYLVAHFFNHQTHHRGQAHAMLTAAGGKPADTDLMLIQP